MVTRVIAGTGGAIDADAKGSPGVPLGMAPAEKFLGGGGAGGRLAAPPASPGN